MSDNRRVYRIYLNGAEANVSDATERKCGLPADDLGCAGEWDRDGQELPIAHDCTEGTRSSQSRQPDQTLQSLDPK